MTSNLCPICDTALKSGQCLANYDKHYYALGTIHEYFRWEIGGRWYRVIRRTNSNGIEVGFSLPNVDGDQPVATINYPVPATKHLPASMFEFDPKQPQLALDRIRVLLSFR